MASGQPWTDEECRTLESMLASGSTQPRIAAALERTIDSVAQKIKRLSVSYYVRCLMFEYSQEMGIAPQRPEIFVPVSGTFALTMLLIAAVGCLAAGTIVFSRREYLEET